MIDLEVFERYSLQAVGFNEQNFQQNIGQRLLQAGLEEVADTLQSEAIGKIFLDRELGYEERRVINSTEAIISGEEAAIFQNRVRQVEIQESGEPMTNLRGIKAFTEQPWTFSQVPYHPACGDWGGKQRLFWVRETVANTLGAMTNLLSKAEYGLHFEDGFRPTGVQEGLFKRRLAMAAEEHPEWTQDQILLEAQSKTAFTPRFASHKGGAAVDARIRDLRNGKLLDIGHEYPDGGALVAIESPLVTQKQWQNRHLFSLVAQQVGFALYPFEDWHLCIGDTTASATQLSELPVAKFGPIKNFDQKSGDILEIYDQSELDQIFPS